MTSWFQLNGNARLLGWNDEEKGLVIETIKSNGFSVPRWVGSVTVETHIHAHSSPTITWFFFSLTLHLK